MAKRGRPKKIVTNSEPKVKRKVGRPRKNPIGAVKKKTKTIKKSSKIVAKNPRKRGRPRKVAKPVEYSQKLDLPRETSKEVSKSSKSTKRSSGPKSTEVKAHARRKTPVLSDSEGKHIIRFHGHRKRICGL